MEDNQLITIISGDQIEMKIDIRFQNISGLIKSVLDDNPSQEAIPIPIQSSILKIIFQYAKQHNFDPPNAVFPITSDEISQNLASQKDYQLLKQFDKFTIKPILQAAIQLDIPQLQENCISLIASDFYFEPTEEGLEKLKIKHGMFEEITPEMEDYIQKEFPWAFVESEMLQNAIPQPNQVNEEEEKI